MKFVSQARSAFMKAAGHPVMQKITENSAKITATVFAAADTLLMSMNYLKNGSIKIDMPPSNPEQWLSISGLNYIAASAVFLAGDRYNWVKKPVGFLSCSGAAAMAASASQSGWGMYLAAAAPMLTGLSMVFEDQANAAAEKLSSLKNIFAKAGKVYLEYPVATMASVQMLSAGSALVQGIVDPEQHMMIPYALSWIAGNATFILTDNNMREVVREAGELRVKSQTEAQPSVF